MNKSTRWALIGFGFLVLFVLCAVSGMGSEASVAIACAMISFGVSDILDAINR